MLRRTHPATLSVALLGLAIGTAACSVAGAEADDQGASAASSEEEEDADEDEVGITGEALVKASAAALAATGGGRVTGTEAGDEESYYEVEVTMPDGSQIDVQLDEHFEVVSSGSDDEGEDEGDE